MKIAILLYDKYMALDVVGPYQVLSFLPETEVCLTGLEPGLYKDEFGMRLYANYSIADMPSPDVIVVPGGFGINNVLNNTQIIEWLKKANETSLYTTSVCSGALLLASAGLLNGRRATTYWNRKEQLKSYGVEVVNERYVKDGKIITSAGVSAGIDMTLYLAALLKGEDFAKIVQLGIEYDPQPPFDCGTPDKAPRDLVEKIKIKSKK